MPSAGTEKRRSQPHRDTSTTHLLSRDLDFLSMKLPFGPSEWWIVPSHPQASATISQEFFMIGSSIMVPVTSIWERALSKNIAFQISSPLRVESRGNFSFRRDTI